jgi:hypothetical protein
VGPPIGASLEGSQRLARSTSRSAPGTFIGAKARMTVVMR